MKRLMLASEFQRSRSAPPLVKERPCPNLRSQGHEQRWKAARGSRAHQLHEQMQAR
jgi:hypothetical protein